MQPSPQMSDDTDLPNLGILIKLMKMTTSTHDGEALNALRMANKALSKFGGDWETLLRGKVTVITSDPFSSIPETPAAKAPPPKPPPPPVYTPPTRPYNPRPASPPPVRVRADVQLLLDAIEFVTLGQTTQLQIDLVAKDWKTQNWITTQQYNFLDSVARPHVKRTKKRGKP